MTEQTYEVHIQDRFSGGRYEIYTSTASAEDALSDYLKVDDEGDANVILTKRTGERVERLTFRELLTESGVEVRPACRRGAR